MNLPDTFSVITSEEQRHVDQFLSVQSKLVLYVLVPKRI